MLKRETNNWNVTVQDAIKINTANGDTLFVTLPPQSNELPNAELEDMFRRVALAFKEVFDDKDIKVIIAQHGTKVEIIKRSELQDK